MLVGALARGVPHPPARALWLKRNHLAPGCGAALGRLLAAQGALTLLDLSHTGLLDGELAAAAAALVGEGAGGAAEASPAAAPPLPLRHLFLDATGLTDEGVGSLASILATGRLSLASLSLLQNPLGVAGVTALAAATPYLPALQRLNLGGTGMTGYGVAALVDGLLAHCPGLRHLSVGWFKTSHYLRAPPNGLGAAGAAALATLLASHPSIETVDVSRAPGRMAGLAPDDLAVILAALRPHQSLVGVADRHGPAALRRLKEPRRVQHIDSVYRTA